jgi:multiple sugar transport system permease protein
MTLAVACLQWAGLAMLAAGVVRIARGAPGAWMALGGYVAAAGPAVLVGGAQGRPWSLRLALPVLPFPGMVAAACVVGLAVVAVQAFVRQGSPGARLRRLRVACWLGATLLAGAWWHRTGEAAEVVPGAVGFGPTELAGAAALALGAVGWATWLSRRAARRAKARIWMLHAALASGCVVFGLPMYWLVLTSLRDQNENTATDTLRFQPRVAATRPVRDPERPLVRAEFQGEQVLARVVRTEGGTAELEVERPFRLRGFLFEREAAGLVEVDRRAEVVTLPEGGRATVLRALEGGRVVVRRDDGAGTEVRVRSELEPVYEPGFRWENYSEALEWLPAETRSGLVYLMNSVWLAVLNVSGTLFSCALAGFAFSRMRFPGKSGLFGLLLASMMLPSAVTMVPRFLLWKSVGAVDTLVPLWLPSFFGNAFFIFLLRQFYQTLPKELEDAAKMDGCGFWRTCWQVMTPQVGPALAVIGLWTFFGSWNDFVGPLTYLSTPERMPLAYAVQLFRSDRGGEIGLMMAFAAMATAPLLVAFLFAQRRLVEGVQLSGLGGR